MYSQNYNMDSEKKRSIESQLIFTVQDLAADLDKGQQIDAVLLDFSKAFDEVPHRRLLLKLHHSGVRSNTMSWMDCRISLRSLPMSTWSLVASVSVLMGLYRRQSSANSLSLDETQGGMSFM
jgi:hypothetical protein